MADASRDLPNVGLSLVETAGLVQRSCVIVGATIELANVMSLKVVAEGVETDEGLPLLRRWDGDQARDECVGEPMPAPAFEQWPGAASRASARTVAA